VQERGSVQTLTGRRVRGPAGIRRPRCLEAALGVGALVVAADQITKSLAEADLRQGPVHLVGPLSLTLTYNRGSAFSLFTGWAPLLAVVAVVLVVVLAVLASRTRRLPVAVALGLVIGGALGNLADRLFRGHGGAVVDFVDLRFWPTFNVADAAIVIGIVVLVILLWRRPATEGPPRQAIGVASTSPAAGDTPPASEALRTRGGIAGDDTG
jgi:signal peptidase II